MCANPNLLSTNLSAALFQNFNNNISIILLVVTTASPVEVEPVLEVWYLLACKFMIDATSYHHILDMEFIGAPCAQLYSLAETPQPPPSPALGSYTRALLVSQDR